MLFKRRATRTATIQTTTGQSFKTVDADKTQKDWHPGQEPGLDPAKPNGGRQAPMLYEKCQITVVDYSEDDMEMHDFNNDELIEFLKTKQEDWIKCRWINVNGLSWDVIQALAAYKKLHKLAIEDLVNIENRTKADWYTDHTFIVMTLFKLIHLHADQESECDSEDGGSIRQNPGVMQKLRKAVKNTFSPPRPRGTYPAIVSKNAAAIATSVNGSITGHTIGDKDAPIKKMRTLQRYHSGRNEEGMVYMEKHSVLTPQQMAVSAEQVSIFLTSDNTVVSFFENSADDLETPILHRLCTPDTILRRSCDASLLLQALMDAIIDLAIPVTKAYEDVIGELELNVLTEPSIKHTQNLYIATTEITKMRSNISPTVQLINALRDHKIPRIDGEGFHGQGSKRSAHSTVDISATARTYLGDVEDHILQMTDSLDTMRRSCDNMIDLIFNTISAYQNESMKQLTIVTIIFLPLSFLSGYFGMNFEQFEAIKHTDAYFWKIAVPVATAIIIWLMRDTIAWYVSRLIQKRGISRTRKGRLTREKEEKRNR
ncbi:hypothetical protein B0O99DRAFT_503764 [Bisporella sp. PMI_857]|nr:hypothetical protein B0O99DRAFT_503764 [Bisporella sp. PMI_857]